MSKVNIQVQSNTSTNDIDVNEIYEWQSLIPVVQFKVLKHRDFEFVNITSKSEFLQFFMKHVCSFIRLQRPNSIIKTKRVFPLFSHKRS
jgi:hypothetical protein